MDLLFKINVPYIPPGCDGRACVCVCAGSGGISSLVIVVRASFGMALTVSGGGKVCGLNTLATAQ